jgi:dihydropteroate synthase
MQVFRCGKYALDLRRPAIMAILNLTLDSFSGDGLGGHGIGALLARAERAIAEGAAILDVGGESTRPGADPVPETEELDRVLPAIEALAQFDLPISLDTIKPAVMRAGIRAGAAMINDVGAFRAPGAVEAVASASVGLCVMHMKGEPRTMQVDPSYEDVETEVRTFLLSRTAQLADAGVAAERVCIDPGFGFGKRPEHNLLLMRGIGRLAASGFPVLVGLSRKSVLGAITGRPVTERVVASAAAALLAVDGGARIVRVHDVGATRDALQVWESLRAQPEQ